MGSKLKTKTKVKCPICKKVISWEKNPYRPFCSKECKLADLYNWLTEEYKISMSLSETEQNHKEKKEI